MASLLPFAALLLVRETSKESPLTGYTGEVLFQLLKSQPCFIDFNIINLLVTTTYSSQVKINGWIIGQYNNNIIIKHIKQIHG